MPPMHCCQGPFGRWLHSEPCDRYRPDCATRTDQGSCNMDNAMGCVWTARGCQFNPGFDAKSAFREIPCDPDGGLPVVDSDALRLMSLYSNR
jgi:hypothetical protein